jgi:restriction endonuclease S subunit
MWKEALVKPVKEMFHISSGYPFRKKIKPVINTGSYVIQMKNVCEDKGVLWDEVVESEVSKATKSKHELSDKDILFIARGTRNIAVTLNIPENINRLYAAPQFYVLRLKNESVLPEFAAWYFNSSAGQSYWSMNCEGSVTKSIRRNVLEEFEMVIPDIGKQRKIVELNNLVINERLTARSLIDAGRQMMKGITQQLIKSETLSNDR